MLQQMYICESISCPCIEVHWWNFVCVEHNCVLRACTITLFCCFGPTPTVFIFSIRSVITALRRSRAILRLHATPNVRFRFRFSYTISIRARYAPAINWMGNRYTVSNGWEDARNEPRFIPFTRMNVWWVSFVGEIARRSGHSFWMERRIHSLRGEATPVNL